MDPSYTVADAGACLPFPTERLLKVIAFKKKAGSFILATVRGPDRIDYRKLAVAIGTKRADVLRLTPEEVVDVFGVEVGSVSPIILQGSAKVFFDSEVSTQETVFCGIGRADRTLDIRLGDLVHLTQGTILPLIDSK